MASSLSREWLDRDETVLAGVLPRITELVAVRGEGSYVYDVDGSRYLDFSCGIGVTNIGHCHPTVVAAVQRQAAQLMHTSVVMHTTPMIELAERLTLHTPFFQQPQVFFCNSGAEAVDGALKLARRTTQRPGVICFRGGFHGRTIAATSLTTTKTVYREGYEPLLPSVHVAPYVDPMGRDGDGIAATARALDALDELLSMQAPGANIGAMIVEPVLGEGGYVVPPRPWLRGLRARCDEHGILLIFDEVQCGMGRTGQMFAAETFSVTPDVLLFAKGVASGLPLGGIIAPRRLMADWPVGAHGSTFGGNPVSCAAALATLDVIEQGALLHRVTKVGDRLRLRLAAATAANPTVRDVRGVGLMIGVELSDAAAAHTVQDACLASGLIVLTTGPRGNIVRLIPPFTLTDDEAEEGATAFERALAEVAPAA